MCKQTKRGCAIITMMLLVAGPSLAQDDADAALRKDLTSVIALLGLPCGEVVSVTRLGEDNNLAVCKDGNRYRVYINDAGRVAAQKQ